MTEVWKPIISYGGRFADLYGASSLGRIRRNNTGHVLAQTLAGRDRHYYYVRLWDGQGRTCPVAMLIAEAFLGPKPKGLAIQINHKDGVRTNNAITNLEFVTSKRNGEHAADNALKAWGIRHAAHKLTEAQVREIRSTPYATERALAARYGVVGPTIHSIRTRKTWRHLP